ncbi:unnamed protein product [Cladocopium goreaui]|uniref:Uncharacterized protein YMR196W n=1 Tax=Cladocopium goreaui TaxID=2562237 RepID=A0A9P1DC24_9DINO|nr:unnamed protein product [Cladocopium goreaui]
MATSPESKFVDRFRQASRSAFDPSPMNVSGKDLREISPEHGRLAACEEGSEDWKRWGPYVSERHWGTCREDYAGHGNSWIYLPFEASHYIAYRWGEDGLAGWCDRSMQLCLGLALWNGKASLKNLKIEMVCSPRKRPPAELSCDAVPDELSPAHDSAWLIALPAYADLVSPSGAGVYGYGGIATGGENPVLKRPSPPFGDVSHSTESRCFSAKIVGPGGVDQVQAFNDCWAVCGYNLMKEFGGQSIPSPPSPPSLRSDLVVVRNKAFSINYADICIRWGLYESALRYVGWPIIPGFDLAGEVEVAGADSAFSVGDRVFGCSFFGAYASRVVVPSWQVMKMPDDMTFESAAAFPTVVLTALHAVNLAGAPELIGRGRDALVHSAAGGVGDMLCQLLRLYGLRVVGVVGSQSKVRSCKADVVIDKSSEDWAKAAARHAPDGYRAVFDANGVATLKASYNLLSRNGRLVVYGFHSNLPKCDGGLGALSPLNWIRMAIDLARTPHFDPMFLTLDSKAVLGFNLSFFSDEIETGEKYLKQLKSWIEGGKISVPPIRKFHFSQLREEKLYGLSNPQGNHGEDVKELYYYLDATPTHSYMKMMYKYPQAEFPYDELRRVNFERKKDPLLLEYELLDTGIFDDNRYFDVEIEYAQANPDDTLVQITAHNRGKEEAELCILPQAWFRNTWSWNHSKRPSMTYVADKRRIEILHEKLGSYHLYMEENTEVRS